MKTGPLVMFLLTLPFVFASQQPSLGQPQTQNDARQANPRTEPVRPRIGVALEGGGALGLAHIGVLQWFEDHHIPVDYIAGTSMGGLVGGFYASGVSPAKERELVRELDWGEILGGATPHEDLAFRRKEDLRASQNSLVIGLRYGLSLPSGLNSGHEIGLLIDRIALPYDNLKSFDELPIPFRCVATDLVSGKPIVFQKPPLSEALRATMSIPGVFSPVYGDNKVLVDGGLLNNLPSDVVRAMGADIVIAVHLDTPAVTAKQIRSIVNVLNQAVRVVIAESEARGMAEADVLVSVPLSEYGTMDYQKSEPIIEKGYAAAAKKAPLLNKLALRESEWQGYLHEREARERKAKPVPEFLEVQGTSDAERARDIERFLQPLVGEPLGIDRLDAALTQLTGLGRYDSVGYRLTEQEGKQGLVIEVTERNYAPPTIQPSVVVDVAQSESVSLTAAARLTFLDAAGFRSEWRTDFSFGANYVLASELYKPLGPTTRWFLAPRGETSGSELNFYSKTNPAALYWLYRSNIGMDVGYEFSRFRELRIGYEVGYLDTKLRLGTPPFAPLSGRTGAARLHLVTDHTDDPVVPRRGYRAETVFRWYDTSPNAASAFPFLNQTLEYYQPLSPLGSVLMAASGGSTFGVKNTGIPQFFLGGTLRLSAYGLNELQGDQYYYFRGGYLHDLWTLPPLLGKKVYATGIYEFGKMYGTTNESRFPNDVAIGLIAQTALGPMFVGASAGDTGHYKWFFQLGHVF
jgi:NTE family protein